MWTLVFLIIWLGAGLYLAGEDAYVNDFRFMNSILIRDWLFSEDTGAGYLKTWFLVLCAAMAVMGINLIFCSWSKIFRIMRAKFSGRQLYMLIIHALFGFVALGHLGGLMLGFEYNNIRIGEGKKHRIEESYEIEVTRVNFVGDIRALRKSRREITRDDLDYRQSYVEVTLSKDGKLLENQKVYLLKPMNYRDVHVTLRSFVLPKKMDGEPGPDTKVLAMFTLSKNPVLKPFLALYTVMIAGIFIYLVITWRKANFVNNNSSN